MNSLMEYKGYHARVEYSDEDHTFVGEVIDIVDSINFDADSVSELETMFHNSIDDYLAFCDEVGKAPEKEFKGSFNVRVSSEVHRAATIAAERKNISLNQYVGEAIEAHLRSDNLIKAEKSSYYEHCCECSNVEISRTCSLQADSCLGNNSFQQNESPTQFSLLFGNITGKRNAQTYLGRIDYADPRKS